HVTITQKRQLVTNGRRTARLVRSFARDTWNCEEIGVSIFINTTRTVTEHLIMYIIRRSRRVEQTTDGPQKLFATHSELFCHQSVP
ncbi:hypothetical protein PMAYCL1PPCAC_00064, partial [Pristionchus mayeri]